MSRQPRRGEEVFGQLLVAPLGSAGTYAEFAAVSEDAPLAPVPDGLDPEIAAALPTADVTAHGLSSSVEPLSSKTVLIIDADGGVGVVPDPARHQASAHFIANAMPQEVTAGRWTQTAREAVLYCYVP